MSALATLAASLCLQPLLEGGWWVPPTALAILGVGSAGVVLRGIGAPAPLQPIGQAAVVLMTLTGLFARDEAVAGLLPGPAALGRLAELVAQGRDYAEATHAPAGPDEGLLLLIVGGVGLAALCVDSLGAGLDLPGLALAPLAALYIVPLGITGTAPTWAFVLVALSWLAVLASAQGSRTASWGPGVRPGSSAVAIGVTGSSIAAAIVAGTLVPAHDPVGTLDFGTSSSPGTVRIDAMVSLRRSLVGNDTRVVITYGSGATQPDYLRLAVLEDFDGEQWTPSRSSLLARSLPGWPPAGERPELVAYELDVGPLGGATIPSPPGTVESPNPWPVAWDGRTSLPIRNDGQSIEGTSIDLAVLPPPTDPGVLRQASREPVPPSRPDLAANLENPQPLTGPQLPALAAGIVAGASTPFDQAVALQEWFRSDGRFTYSTSIPGGSGRNALADFLDQRVGYCEQFAATMALMARAVGIPARVVVGFTQGVPERGRWVVRGTDAHAWPELWMGSAGWVRFEPTPGATTASAPRYTQPGDATPEDPAPTQEADEAPVPEGGDVPAQVPQEDPGTGGTTGQANGRALAPLLAAAVCLLALAPAVVRTVRRRRRLAAATAESAYREVVDTMVDLGMPAEAWTPRATIDRLRTRLGAQADLPAARILDALEAGRYGGAPPRADDRLAGDTGHLLTAMRRSVSRGTRVRAVVLPRSVVGRSSARSS